MSITKSLACSLFVATLAMSGSPVFAAGDANNDPVKEALADGQLTKDELAMFAVAGQRQLVKLTEFATNEYSAKLSGGSAPMPAAWMLLDDGTSIKQLNLDNQAGDAPADVRILVYRAALKSIARRGKINAAVILYAGKLNEESNTDVMVIEHEHRLGISGNKVIPYEVNNKEVVFGEAVASDKPFQIFYDDKGPQGGAANTENAN